MCSLIICCACNETGSIKEHIEVFHMDDGDIKKVRLSTIPDSILGNPLYVMVKEKQKELMCQRFDKIAYHDDKFFVLDVSLKKLIVCDKWGNIVSKVGTRGNGPGEYVGIIDFDIDSKGYIYCIDGQLNKLFIYASDLKISKVVDLPFEADAIQVMDNGDMLFGLSSWNKGEGEGYKLMLTDKELKEKCTMLPYDEYKDDNYWISLYSFTKHQGRIIYNQPIDNNVYILNPSKIEHLQSLLFDFGSRNVPDEQKKDIERNLKDFEHYTLLKSPVVATSNYVVGTLLDGRKTRFFVYDIKNQVSYEGEEKEEYDNSQFVGYSEPYVISVINPTVELSEEDTAYPDSVKSHILQEGRVIVLRQLYSK